MKLSDMPGKADSAPTRSAVAGLPEDVISQIVAAVGNDTHSTRTIAEWVRAEGYGSVTESALEYWIRKAPECPARGSWLGKS